MTGVTIWLAMCGDMNLKAKKPMFKATPTWFQAFLDWVDETGRFVRRTSNAIAIPSQNAKASQLMLTAVMFETAAYAIVPGMPINQVKDKSMSVLHFVCI